MVKWRKKEEVLSRIAEYDASTAMHSRRVESLAEKFISFLPGHSKEFMENVCTAALLHDAGKLYIPKNILSKPGALTPLERHVMDHHAFFGYKILKEFGFTPKVCGMVLLHHGENLVTDLFDGCSKLLKDDEIRKGAEIISCCDIYDAMTNNRPYRAAVPPEKGVEALYSSVFIPREIKVSFEHMALSCQPV